MNLDAAEQIQRNKNDVNYHNLGYIMVKIDYFLSEEESFDSKISL